MKTKLYYILVTIIVIGMVFPAFAGSPDKDKADKAKTDNLLPSSLPVPTWNLYIHITDDFSKDTCDAAKYCNLGFLIQPATTDCVGIPTDPPQKKPFYLGTYDYQYSISNDYPCVIVSIIDLTGNCTHPINTNTCCTCKENNHVCNLKICPN